MDNYEKRIKEILDRPITVSAQFEYAIDTAFLNKAKKSNNVFNNFSLKFATTVVCLLLTFSTAVFAAYMIYENIWKDPERTSRKQREESVLAPIDEEELNNIISEEKAKTIATTIIKNLGYENKTISEIKDQNEGAMSAVLDFTPMYEFREKCKCINDIRENYEVVYEKNIFA